MKKFFGIVLSVASLFCAATFATGCADDNTIIVQTNAYFAPFEYYDGSEIVGVDVDIMNKVGEKMGKEVKFQNGDFATIIDIVHEGKMADVGAAGITITPERAEKVDFSTPYYTSIQYVIWEDDNFTTNSAGNILWTQLQGKKIGVQLDTTGNLYVDGEITGDGYDGVLKDSGAECVEYDDAQMAVQAMTSTGAVDCVVVDQLPAQYLTENTKGVTLHCAALYYENGAPTEEKYAICVTPGKDDLLNAINEVLEEMIANKEIDALVSKHLGLEN